MSEAQRLSAFRANVYSQAGEDGVIREILSRLGLQSESALWCVEFGAWDGKFLSNTFHLVESHEWNAVFIEGDPVKFHELTLTSQLNPRIVAIQAYVSGHRGGGSALDDLLARTEIPADYAVLSVDIDSTDLDTWARHEAYRPAIVLIEVNSSIEPGILQWHAGGKQVGNSFSATLGVGKAKGYSLVCHTGNMIFVADEFAEAIGLPEIDRLYPERLFDWKNVNARSTMRVRGTALAMRLPTPVKGAAKKILRRGSSGGSAWSQ